MSGLGHSGPGGCDFVWQAQRLARNAEFGLLDSAAYYTYATVFDGHRWRHFSDPRTGEHYRFDTIEAFLTAETGLGLRRDPAEFFACLIAVSESKAEVAPEARELRRLLVRAGMKEPERPLHLGDSPEVLAGAINRQFTVEQRRELVRALQSPELRVSRQEADRLRKRALRGTDLAARACEHCGKVFEPKRSQARFCGGSCRAKASQERKEAPAAPAKRQFIEVDAKKESTPVSPGR
jgi:hypothetical protein